MRVYRRVNSFLVVGMQRGGQAPALLNIGSDEPARLSLGMVASLQSPPPFRPASSFELLAPVSHPRACCTRKAAQTSGLNVWLAFAFVVVREADEAVTPTVRVDVRSSDRPRRVVAVGDSTLIRTAARPRNVEGRQLAAGDRRKP